MSKAQTPIDIDAVLAENRRKRQGAKCAVCVALADMSDDWRVKFEAAIEDTVRYSATSLVNAFERVDVMLSRSSVERHRNRDCLGRRGRT